MDKPGLLRSIAQTGYNVGFGAKKHFATYDLVEKAPGWIGLISAAFGIYALVFDSLSSKFPSATLTIAGIAALYISLYRSEEYNDAGKKLTVIFNELRDLYRSVQGGADVAESHEQLRKLENTFYAESISKQILFSDWYAHFKFFGQHQIDWIENELSFRFWKDKIPNSFKLAVCIFIPVFITILFVIYIFS